MIWFQSTHPRGVRPKEVKYKVVKPPMFQSTHPRGVRLGQGSWKERGILVSIHAPARGATLYRNGRDPSMDVSIHAPARGATQLLSIMISVQRCFNPRTREGCDV